jgi:hypothetical protein
MTSFRRFVDHLDKASGRLRDHPEQWTSILNSARRRIIDSVKRDLADRPEGEKVDFDGDVLAAVTASGLLVGTNHLTTLARRHLPPPPDMQISRLGLRKLQSGNQAFLRPGTVDLVLTELHRMYQVRKAARNNNLEKDRHIQEGRQEALQIDRDGPNND